MISFSKIGKCESTPLCTFRHLMEENMHPFFFCFSFVQNVWNSIQLLFGSYIFSEVDVFPGISKPLKDSLLYDHLILLSKQYIDSTFTLTPGFKPFTCHSTFTVVNLRILIRQELSFWKK